MFADGEPTVAYEDYHYTPFSDPSAVKLLWKEHFKRKDSNRNPEVKRAFDVECSIYQFMYPELSKDKVTSEVMKKLKGKTKPSKGPYKLVFRGIVKSELCKNSKVKAVSNKSLEKCTEENEIKQKNFTVIKKGMKAAEQPNVDTSKFVDEKFIDFKRPDVILETNINKMSKNIPKSEKVVSVKVPKRQSTIKPKPRISKSGTKLEFEDGQWNTPDITAESFNSDGELNPQPDFALKGANLTDNVVNDISAEKKYDDQILTNTEIKPNKEKSSKIKKNNESSLEFVKSFSKTKEYRKQK